MTEEELEKMLEKWVKRLRLQDWDISIRFVKQHELSDPAWEGECRVAPQVSSADILILAPEAGEEGRDIEACVVHELTHVLLYAFNMGKSGSLKNVLREAAVERIAQSLVATDREKV